MHKKRVAIQGIRGAFHHLAAQEYFGAKGVDIVECPTFQGVCDTLVRHEADCGVMAIRNTIAGEIESNNVLIKSYGFKIVDELRLKVMMNLMALPGEKIEMLEDIYSHSIALKQCRNFLAHYPHWKQVEVSNTAEAAKILSQRKMRRCGAIASEVAANIYGLEILANNIQDHEQNFTDFLVIRL